MRSRRSLGRGFQALLAGSLVSNTGDGIRLAALPLLAASLTSSPLLISAVTAAQYLPWITFAPIGGALVDRRDRRQTILVTQAWRGVIALGLALLVLTSNAEIWHVCVVAFMITVGEILVDPSTVALIPTLVDDAELDRANAQLSSAEIITNDFAGAPVGAGLFAFAPWVPFLVDGCSYLGSVLPFSRMPRAERSRPTAGGAARSLRVEAREGFDWLRSHPVLGPLTIAQVVYFFGVASSLSLLVVLVTDELAGSSAAFGLVLALGALGAFVGTLIGAPLAARYGTRWSLSASVAFQAVGLAAAAVAPSIPALAVLWFLNGLPAGMQRPISRSLQQRLTPNELLGRVNVTARMCTRGIVVVGSLVAGVLAARSGVRWSFALGAVAQFVAAVLMWRALRHDQSTTG